MLQIVVSMVVALQLQSAHLVTIDVAGHPRGGVANSITISRDTVAQGWRAERRWEGGSQQVTSADCPALDTVVSAFGQLDDIPVNPPALRALTGRGLPFGPILLHGYGTRLTFPTRVADGSDATIQISGGVAYQVWADDTIRALFGCWGILRSPR